MVKGADIIVRLIHSPSKSGEPRHEGPHREIRKAINAGKPVIEIFYLGAKDTPNRPLNERNYKFRIPIYIKRGESLENALNRGLDELYNRRNP